MRAMLKLKLIPSKHGEEQKIAAPAKIPGEVHKFPRCKPRKLKGNKHLGWQD